MTTITDLLSLMVHVQQQPLGTTEVTFSPSRSHRATATYLRFHNDCLHKELGHSVSVFRWDNMHQAEPMFVGRLGMCSICHLPITRHDYAPPDHP